MTRRSAHTLLSALLVSFLNVCLGQLPAQPIAASGLATNGSPPNIGPAPHTTTDRSSIEPAAVLSASSGSAGFGIDVNVQYLRYIHDTTLPGEWDTVSAVSGTYWAGDFVGNDYSKLYVIDEASEHLHTLDVHTGVTATVGQCPTFIDYTWTGVTSTPDGTLYGVSVSADSSRSYLHRISTSGGSVTVIGRIYNAPAVIDIAIDADGEMYGVDIENDNLIRINTSTGSGTVVGSIGFDANFVQGMDFDPATGVLYYAAYNDDWDQGELRTVNTATGATTYIGAFKEDHEAAVWAMTPSWVQYLGNPGFESGLAYWGVDGAIPGGTAHSGSGSVMFSGEESYVWQDTIIPADAIEVVLAYWITGSSSEAYWDEDITCAAIRDLSWSVEYVDEVCFDMRYFVSSPGVWRHRVHRLNASELANVRGKIVRVGFWLTQAWGSYSQPSTAYIDDTAILVTRPIYDYAVYLPLTIR